MSKKKTIGIVAGTALGAMTVSAHVMRRKSKKTTYEAESIDSIKPRKMGFYEKYIKRAMDVVCFLTRQDGQIKHMGYRIELGEIETVLNSIPSMEEVACLFDPERDRIHCVYTGSQESKDIAKLARASLPRYMVPNLYHKVAVMPHNPNGKIDRPKLKEEWIHGNDHRL